MCFSLSLIFLILSQVSLTFWFWADMATSTFQILHESLPAEISTRRIVTKSIFIAPSFNRCPEGYADDGTGICFRRIRVEEFAYWDNIVIKLNALYRGAAEIKPPFQTKQPLSRHPDEYFVLNEGQKITENNDVEVKLHTMDDIENNKPLRIGVPIRRREVNVKKKPLKSL